MMNEAMKNIIDGTRQAITASVVLMFICGFLFPCALSGLGAVLFPSQSKGNIVTVNGQAVGTAFVGQEFTQDYYLWSRPSAYHYNVYTEDGNGSQRYLDGTEFSGLSSGSNNYAPSNPALRDRVETDMQVFLARNPGVQASDIPTDLLTASGSGLDPHISPEAAEVQVPRIANASGLSEETVREIIKANTEGKVLGVFGEPTVNVLMANIQIGKAMGIL
ncbi:K(+)-transporting ATPase subunit C [Megasphaera sp. SW808]|uniref:K(+)-transporting ATPase subunit C n=1 Tax=Megasphaera sp. SW808 TaxID=2530045 RepID=UPI00197CF77C|nr:K(+)-transporting ATPase subunit C [Megasphaera sp. SW808]